MAKWRRLMVAFDWRGGDSVQISSNDGNPVKQPVAWVSPEKYVDYQINSSPALAQRVQEKLNAAGIEATLKPDLEWVQ